MRLKNKLVAIAGLILAMGVTQKAMGSEAEHPNAHLLRKTLKQQEDDRRSKLSVNERRHCERLDKVLQALPKQRTENLQREVTTLFIEMGC
ncbi:hypothetical protein [Aquabacterium sp. CECT 9606]|uniref:hypothetical protein n=1 Tax=Aquabacterium sp. CECT 9606 TaxID=2845822 RepID=UPI001E6152FE|nr:hypothetical protein [Aquabacterium sp. CECT 9606]CAH0354776.1 hypothetical protein AQB9606_03935 [Aquabacterium sp. CECT 9606]